MALACGYSLGEDVRGSVAKEEESDEIVSGPVVYGARRGRDRMRRGLGDRSRSSNRGTREADQNCQSPLVLVTPRTHQVIYVRRSRSDVPPEDITVRFLQGAARNDDSGTTETTVGFAPDLVSVMLLFTHAFTYRTGKIR